MAIFTVTSGEASDLAVVAVSPNVQDCLTIYEYIITANAGDSITINLTGNHFEAKVNNGGTETDFTDQTTQVFGTSLSFSFILVNSGVEGVFSTATVRIDNNSNLNFYETIVTRNNDSVNCYNNTENITRTSQLINDGENTTSTFMEFSDLDTVVTQSSNNPVSSDAVFNAIAGFVTLAGDNVFTGSNTFNGDLIAADSHGIKLGGNTDIISYTDPNPAVWSEASGIAMGLGGGTDIIKFINSNTSKRTYTWPDKDGTVAMISDVVGLGSGDMTKVIYDTNDDGSVNSADFATNAGTLDTLDSTQFLRSDATDSKTAGSLNFNDNILLQFGTTPRFHISHNGTTTLGTVLNGTTFSFYSNAQSDNILTLTDDAITPIAANRNITVPDEVYGAGWDGSTEVPTKNAVYDAIEAVSGGSGAVSSVFTRIGAVTAQAGDYDGLYAAVDSTTANNTAFLHLADNTTDPTLYVNQIGSGDIARFFKGAAIGSTSGPTQITFTNSGGISITGMYSGDGGGLTNVNATTLDGINSTSFLRSDVADTKSVGDLTFAGNVKAVFNIQSELYSNASHTLLNLLSGSFYIQDNATDRFIFDRTTGNLTATGSITFGGGSIMTSGGTGVGAYFDNISGNNWVVRGSSNGSNFSGLWIDSSNHGQLLLRDSSGNLDVQIRADNTSLFNNSIYLTQDSAEIRWGTGADLRIYHDGTQNRIDNYNSMNLQLRQDATERFEFDMTTGALKFAVGNTPDADDLSVTTLNAIYTTANFSGSTNYPTQFGQTLVVRGNDGTDGNRNIYLHKVNGDNHQYYLGYDDSTTGAEFTRVWTDDYNSAGGGGDVFLANDQTFTGLNTFADPDGEMEFVGDSATDEVTLKFYKNNGSTLNGTLTIGQNIFDGILLTNSTSNNGYGLSDTGGHFLTGGPGEGALVFTPSTSRLAVDDVQTNWITTVSDSTGVEMSTTTGSSTSTDFALRSTATGDRILIQSSAITLPDTSTIDITNAGNKAIATKEYVDSVATGAPWTSVYVATITQTGTNAPVLSVIYNDTGFTPSASRSAVGDYDVTVTGANLFSDCTIELIDIKGASEVWDARLLATSSTNLQIFVAASAVLTSGADSELNGVLKITFW